jgi:hypothetical protein
VRKVGRIRAVPELVRTADTETLAVTVDETTDSKNTPPGVEVCCGDIVIVSVGALNVSIFVTTTTELQSCLLR